MCARQLLSVYCVNCTAIESPKLNKWRLKLEIIDILQYMFSENSVNYAYISRTHKYPIIMEANTDGRLNLLMFLL